MYTHPAGQPAATPSPIYAPDPAALLARPGMPVGADPLSSRYYAGSSFHTRTTLSRGSRMSVRLLFPVAIVFKGVQRR